MRRAPYDGGTKAAEQARRPNPGAVIAHSKLSDPLSLSEDATAKRGDAPRNMAEDGNLAETGQSTRVRVAKITI